MGRRKKTVVTTEKEASKNEGQVKESVAEQNKDEKPAESSSKNEEKVVQKSTAENDGTSKEKEVVKKKKSLFEHVNDNCVKAMLSHASKKLDEESAVKALQKALHIKQTGVADSTLVAAWSQSFNRANLVDDYLNMVDPNIDPKERTKIKNS